MDRPRILLAPGASGTIETLRQHEAGLGARDIDVRLVELPRGRAERAIPVYRRALEEVPADEPNSGGPACGAPGRQPSWDERTAHWPRITCPVLLLSGESDPFAQIGLLRRAVARLPDATLVTYPGVGHGLAPVLDEALDRVAAFATDRS